MENIMPEFAENLKGSFWGITTFFNPTGYKSKYKNYRLFRESSKRQRLNLLAVEVVFGTRPFQLKKNEDADILIQIRGDKSNIMWQKERMLNIALQNLPGDCDRITWLDCDLIFKNENWVKETSELLLKYNIVQPFAQAVLLRPGETDVGREPVSSGKNEGQMDNSLGYNFRNNSKDSFNRTFSFSGHMGMAWAARKSVFDGAGFFDQSIIGGGDYIMVSAFLGTGREKYYGDEMNSVIGEWADKISKKAGLSVCFTPGIVMHLWHGKITDRFYHNRLFLFKKENFNPTEDIIIGANGLYAWTGNNEKFQKVVSAYFHIRAEDEGFISRVKSGFFKIYVCFLRKDLLLILSDKNFKAYKKFLKTKKELTLKTLLYLALILSNLLLLIMNIAYHLNIIYFWATVFSGVFLAIIIDLYLRVQHNIDKIVWHESKEIRALQEKIQRLENGLKEKIDEANKDIKV